MGVNCNKTSSSKFHWAFTPKQKLYFLYTFLTAKASIYHFYFSPELFTSKIIRIIKKFKRDKFLQTLATPVEMKLNYFKEKLRFIIRFLMIVFGSTRGFFQLTFFVTSSCNAKCIHCFNWESLNSTKNELAL